MAAPQLWQIYKPDGTLVGPLTPLEVRDAIREGSVEAFDLVARVGSKVKQPVIEVDEIFVAADAAEAGKVDSIYEKKPEEFSNMEPTQANSTEGNNNNRSSFKTEISYDSRKLEQNQVSGNAPKLSKSRQNLGRQAIRRYYIVDKSKNFFGPYSANEIQGQFFRGQVQDSFSVSKDRGGKSVPITRFVAAYSGAKAKNYNSEQTNFNFSALHKIAKKNKAISIFGQPLRRPNNRGSSRQKKASSISTLWILLTAAAIVVGVHQYKNNPQFAALFAPHQDQLYYEPQTQQAVPPLPTPESEIAFVEPMPEEVPVIRPTSQIVSKPTKKMSKKEKPKKKKNLEVQRQAPRAAYRPPVRVVSLAPKNVPSNGYSKSVGTVIKISNLSYDVGQLNSCSLKCRLTATDTKGQKIQLVFFKAQFQNELAKRGGRASARGRLDMQNNSPIIYLQSVE